MSVTMAAAIEVLARMPRTFPLGKITFYGVNWLFLRTPPFKIRHFRKRNKLTVPKFLGPLETSGLDLNIEIIKIIK